MKIQGNDDSQEQRVKELETIRKRLAELERGQKLGLVWRDIPEDVETLLRVEMPVLIHEQDLDIPGKIPSDQSHILIEGDNLHALHVLQATHHAAVDVIYIDPPYNTGNKDFIYNDRFVDAEDSFRHSKWLSFMQKRLSLAKNLLADSGAIFVSIDNNEQAQLKLLGDTIFGEINFIGALIWRKKEGGGQTDQYFVTEHEYIMGWRRTSDYKWQDAIIEDDGSSFTKSDDEGTYKAVKLAKWGNTSRRVDRPKMYFSIKAPNGKSVYPIAPDGGEGRWRVGSKRMQVLIDGKLIEWQEKGKNWIPYEKVYFVEGDTKTIKERSIIYDVATTADGTKELTKIFGEKDLFPNPKPTALIQHLIQHATTPNAIILDFFAGSGTTLHAVSQLNAEDGGSRQCILVTNNENSICRDVTQPRLKAVLTGKWADKQKHDPLPGSLSFYKTGFIKRLKSPDRMRTEIAKHTIDLIAIKEAAGTTVSRTADLTVLHGVSKTIAVVPGLDPEHVKLHANAEKKVREGDIKIVYLFTWSNQGVEDEIAALWPGWLVQPLPSEMLAALRRNAPAPSLFDVDGGAQ